METMEFQYVAEHFRQYHRILQFKRYQQDMARTKITDLCYQHFDIPMFHNQSSEVILKPSINLK